MKWLEIVIESPTFWKTLGRPLDFASTALRRSITLRVSGEYRGPTRYRAGPAAAAEGDAAGEFSTWAMWVIGPDAAVVSGVSATLLEAGVEASGADGDNAAEQPAASKEATRAAARPCGVMRIEQPVVIVRTGA